MSLDRSLKVQSALKRSRSVLTRAERLKVLADEERWTDSKSVFGLPKVRQKKSGAGKKAAKETPAAEGAAPAPAPAKGAAPAKAAAPAAKGGAKGK